MAPAKAQTKRAYKKQCPHCPRKITPGRSWTRHMRTKHPHVDHHTAKPRPAQVVVVERDDDGDIIGTLEKAVVQAVRENRIETARAAVALIDAVIAEQGSS